MGSRNSKSISVRRLFTALDKEHPDAKLALDFESAFQLLVALILAAQSTDANTNEITRTLFDRFPDPASFASAEAEEVEQAVHSSGFFRQKARTLRSCCQRLVDDFAGEVPRDLPDLLSLPGVGRKTANILRGNAWQIPGIGVDTHVGRLSLRLGLTEEKDPNKVEADLVEQVPTDSQIRFCHLLQYHGRRICIARKPDCPKCVLAKDCPYPDKTEPALPAKPAKSTWVRS